MNPKETMNSRDSSVDENKSEKSIRTRDGAQRLSLLNFAVALQDNIITGIYTDEEQKVSRQGPKDIIVAPLARIVAESMLSRLHLKDHIALEFDTTEEVKETVRPGSNLSDDEIDARRVVLGYRWIKPLSTQTDSEEMLSEADKAKEQLERVITDADRAKEELTLLCQSDIAAVAEKYSKNSGDSYFKEELISEGNLGLARALPRFDWRQGYELNTFIGLYISGAMLSFIREKKELMRIPRPVFEANGELQRATEAAFHAGQSPTPKNILAAAMRIDPNTKLTEELIYKEQVFTARVKYFDSLDRETAAGDSVGNGIKEESETDRLEILTDLLSLGNVKEIFPSEIDQKILYLRFYEYKSQLEIAEEIGMSQMHVSRRLKRMLGKFRESLEAKSELDE